MLSVKSFLPATAFDTVTLMECVTNSHSSGCVSEKIIMEKKQSAGNKGEVLEILAIKAYQISHISYEINIVDFLMEILHY